MTSLHHHAQRIHRDSAQADVLVPLLPPAQAALIAAEIHAASCSTCARGRACQQLLVLANRAASLHGAHLPPHLQRQGRKRTR